MAGEKFVVITLKDDLSKWVEKLKRLTRLSEGEVIEGLLYLLRVATSTELGRVYVALALKASRLFEDRAPNGDKGNGRHPRALLYSPPSSPPPISELTETFKIKSIPEPEEPSPTPTTCIRCGKPTEGSVLCPECKELALKRLRELKAMDDLRKVVRDAVKEAVIECLREAIRGSGRERGS
jgi:hypothetical protein